MKKTFKSILDNATPQQLEPFFDELDTEAVSEKTVAAIQARVTGSSEAKAKKPGLLKWILPAASAVCVVILAGVLIGSPLFSGQPASVPAASTMDRPSATAADKTVQTNAEPTADTSVFTPESSAENMTADTSVPTETLPGPESGIVLTITEDSNDRFSAVSGPITDNVHTDGSKGDRPLYDGIRFFEDGEATYMIYAEYRPLYLLEGTKRVGSSHSSSHSSTELLFFANGTNDGWTYAGGAFHCVGGYEKGLFRVNLQSGEIEKVIDCSETVSSAVVAQGKIFYASRSGFGDQALYSLKRADPEKEKIECLLSDADYPISDLKMIGETLYFRSFPQGIFFITPDLSLHLIPSPSVNSYCVRDGIIYTFSVTSDKAWTKREKTIRAFSENGELLASRSFEEFSESGVMQNVRYYSGGSRDSLTVYQGKIVSFDESGFYLEDLFNGSREKILDCVFTGTQEDGYVQGGFYLSVSKTIFNGKLYLQYGDTIVEYDGGTVRVIEPE